jgi:hypothetical protein
VRGRIGTKPAPAATGNGLRDEHSGEPLASSLSTKPKRRQAVRGNPSAANKKIKRKRPSAASAKASSKGSHGSRQRSKDAAGSKACLEITIFTKSGGPLTKGISLSADGSIKSDGSACRMARGDARRVPVANAKQLAALIERTRSNQAIGLGTLRPDLRDEVDVVTKAKLANGVARPDLIARTGTNIIFRKGEPAFALLDFDTKGMPPSVAAVLKRLGGFLDAMKSVLPALAGVATVTRRSTSAGLFRSDTGIQLPGSDGLHVYPLVQDGADIPRFLRVLHEYCWLAGLGWMRIGRAGQMLERSLIDHTVGRPERLVFEGRPVLEVPLEQDRELRRPVVVNGDALNTATACPSLSYVDTAKLDELRAREKQRLRPEAVKVRAAYIEEQASRIAERTGVSMDFARRTVVRQCDGVLHPNAELIFDDDEFNGCTVVDILDDPERFEGATLADPVEGVEYGRCKAVVMRGSDGTPFIHSYAHGRTFYELKLDFSAVRSKLEKAEKDAIVKTLTELAAAADLDPQEREELCNLAAERSGTGKRTVPAMLKTAERKYAEQRAEQERERRFAERADPRPLIRVPAVDAPWAPEMRTLDDVLGASTARKPPTRDIDGVITRTRKLPVPNMHAFTDANATKEE